MRWANAPVQRARSAELRTALQAALSTHFDRIQRIVDMRRRPSVHGTSFALEELEVHLDDGTILPVMFKDLSWEALLAHARRAKPAFLYDPLREIETYRVILATHQIGAPTCYGTVVDPQLGRHWLFLEHVPGVELYQVGDFAVWLHVARWLAVTHTRLAENLESLARCEHLLRYDAQFYRRWLHRAQSFVRQAAPASSRSIDHLARHYDRLIDRLIALPPIVLHGELYASNVLVHTTTSGTRVCPVDWEMAAVGPGLIDLAALTAGAWTEAEKRALALAYYDALVVHKGRHLEPDAFLAALDCCRLHLSIQWLGWSRNWSPPPEHTQDWLGEALMLSERLRL